MIYIIEGEEEVFIKHKIREICNQTNSEILKFDGNSKDFDINKLLESLSSNSLFSDRNTILVKDAPFLCKKFEDKQLEQIVDYINNPYFENDLIFYTLENKHNGKLKMYKAISKNANVIEMNSYDYKQFATFVNQQVNRAKLDISKDALYLLNTICKRNATLLIKNIEVLSNYPGKITIDVVEKLCTASDDNDSFEMINSLTNKDISKTISLERKMINENDSVISVIGLLSSQLRFLYQLSYLVNHGKKKNEIIDITKCSEGRYIKSLDTLRKLSQLEIVYLLNELSKIDIECKTNNSVSDITRFEMFILNLLKKDNYASN